MAAFLMSIRSYLPLCLLPTFLFAGADSPNASIETRWHTSALVARGLKHSDVALMPEGTPADYELFRPLQPTIVAWGEDALPVLDGGREAREKLERAMASYRQLGIREIAANIWMLTATERFMHRHPEFQDAVCIDLWGEKILPSWLADAEYDGVKPWWGCTNHPLFAEHVRQRMRAGLQAGASMVHLDDHAGTAACAAHSGGCFCAYCLCGFRGWLQRNVSAAELAAAGVGEVARFDYRAFLSKRGYADRAAFIAESWQGRVPLWSWFLAFQREAAVNFVETLQREAAELRGGPVPFGVNAYNLDPTQLFDAHVVDYFANEVEQFDQEDLVAPVAYRLGEALGRPVFATGTGEDWIAYRQSRATVRVHRWIAQAYAFGQWFMYSWRKWGFSPATGTRWTEVDPQVFRPMVAFVRAHRDWFDGFESTGAVALLYDNASAKANRWGVRTTSRALLDAGVPYDLVVNGDALLGRPLTLEALRRYQTVVVPPDTARTDALSALLDAWQRSGGRLVEAADAEIDALRLPGRIDVAASGRVWALPRVRRDANTTAAMAVHLLNRDYDAGRDAMERKSDVRLTLDLPALDGPAAVRRVRYLQPGAEPRELAFTVDQGSLSLTVPELEVWGIVAIE